MTQATSPFQSSVRPWADEAVRRIEADVQRSSDTHLIPLLLPWPGISLYFKDESSHPSGSLKHRLARSLFLYALVNGWLREGSTVIESSSGSTAVSEAYFARLLGLPFIAVMPRSTSPEKLAAIEFQGGRCHLVDSAADIGDASRELAIELGGHYMDQFTFAERATDWRGNNNIAESIFHQLELEPDPVPRWLVAAAGTGGTLATLGRYVRYCRHPTKVCGVDPERSVFFDCYTKRDRTITRPDGSRIEGIGRPVVGSSFLPDVIDAMVKIPDAWSVGAMAALNKKLGRAVGASTGTNLVASLLCAGDLAARGERGSIVTLLCDGGERYRRSYYDAAWLGSTGLECTAQCEAVTRWLDDGIAPPAELFARAGALGNR
ncbi:MAG: PLP-dependent cysteine synthase family protein [Polyangia bacterium]